MDYNRGPNIIPEMARRMQICHFCRLLFLTPRFVFIGFSFVFVNAVHLNVLIANEALISGRYL